MAAMTGYNPPGVGRSTIPMLSPWLTKGDATRPRDFKTLLEISEFIWENDAVYRSAMERIIAYFMTDIYVSGLRDTNELTSDERQKYEGFLKDTLNILEVYATMERCVRCYGNAFASLIVPIRRSLFCRHCSAMYAAQRVLNDSVFKFRYNSSPTAFDNGKSGFIATCPICNTTDSWIVKDNFDEFSKAKVAFWNPRQIEIVHDPYSGQCQYIWRIPGTHSDRIKRGDRLMLANWPISLLTAVAKGTYFVFNDGVIFHAKEDPLPGRESHGWGIPLTTIHYGYARQHALMRKINETIASDYSIPFRAIHPDTRNGGSDGIATDPLQTIGMSSWIEFIQDAIAQHGSDPSAIQVFPFPVKYALFGGEANQLAPFDLMKESEDAFLNAVGCFAELYRGTLQFQSAPSAIRLFESLHRGIPRRAERFSTWLAAKISIYESWRPIRIKLKPVTIADDFQKQMALLQLAAGGQISQSRALEPFNIDFETEQRLKADEVSITMEQEAQSQKELESQAYGEEIAKSPQQMAQGGGQAPPATGGVGGGGVMTNASTPMTGQDFMAEAESVAMQLLSVPQGAERNRMLDQIRQSNPAMHSMVTASMDKIRGQASSQGRQMAMQQMTGQTG